METTNLLDSSERSGIKPKHRKDRSKWNEPWFDGGGGGGGGGKGLRDSVKKKRDVGKLEKTTWMRPYVVKY